MIEAINRVKGDFAKIIIITHLDELKDIGSLGFRVGQKNTSIKSRKSVQKNNKKRNIGNAPREVLKTQDIFPTRIEVEKTARGSTVEVI